MPCFTSKIVNDKPICSVCVDKKNEKSDDEYYNKIISDKKHIYNALIDTGASGSCISKNVADNLKLIPYGDAEMRGTTGTSKANVYRISLFINILDQSGKGGSITGFHNLQVVETKKISDSFDVILGMDLISRGNLNIGGSLFTFCI